MQDKQYEFMEYLMFGRRLLFPLSRLNHYEEIIKKGMDKSGFELLSLIDLLSNACEYDEKIKISATIKGVQNDVRITGIKLISDMCSYAKKRLMSMYGKYRRVLHGTEFGEYQGCETIITKDGMMPKSYKYYSQKQLSIIKRYEAILLKRKKPSRTEFIKGEIQFCVKNLKYYDVFCKEAKTIKTNEACFLYDVMLLIGAIKSNGDENNQDKYVFIKNKISGKDCTEYHYIYNGHPHIFGFDAMLKRSGLE